MDRNRQVTPIGMDCPRTFSIGVARNADGDILWRRRLNPGDRTLLRAELGERPRGTPVIVEGTFGCNWGSDELATARELRKQESLKLRQRLLPNPAAQTVSYSERRFAICYSGRGRRLGACARARQVEPPRRFRYHIRLERQR